MKSTVFHFKEVFGINAMRRGTTKVLRLNAFMLLCLYACLTSPWA